jgi:hypothetical protein
MLFGLIAWQIGNAQAGEWRVTREILGATEATAVAEVPFDDHVFANSQADWIDVRVLDGAGREVPCVIQAERDYRFEDRHTSREAKIKSLEQMPDGGLAVVCEIERTNAVSLTQVVVRTPLRNYEQTVTVYVQGPENTWRQIQAAEPLFDYSRFADVKKETVTLPGLTNRVFKLVIAQADDKVFSTYTSLTEESDGGKTVQRLFKRYSVESRPFRIDAVRFRDTERIAVADEKRVERITAAEFAATEDAEHKRTTLTFPAGRWPVVGLALNPEQRNFERQVSVECPAPGGWRTMESGQLSRSHLPGLKPSEQSEIGFSETRADRLRVHVRNDDNPPLTFGKESVTLLRQAYAVLFIAEKGGRYRLVYGNPEVKAAPVYEQGVMAYLRSGQKAVVWRLSAAPAGAVTYGASVQLRQFLVRHGMLLLSFLVMAALGALILGAVRRVEKQKRTVKTPAEEDE